MSADHAVAGAPAASQEAVADGVGDLQQRERGSFPSPAACKSHEVSPDKGNDESLQAASTPPFALLS
jgi:hypothetical protein